jgi:hypothetical protein
MFRQQQVFRYQKLVRSFSSNLSTHKKWINGEITYSKCDPWDYVLLPRISNLAELLYEMKRSDMQTDELYQKQ